MMIVFKVACIIALVWAAGILLAIGASYAWADDWLTALGFIAAGVIVVLPSKYDPAIRLKEKLFQGER